MNKGLLSGAAFAALLLSAGTASAADVIIIPAPVPIIEIEEEAGPVVTVTIAATLGRQDDDWELEAEVEAEVVTARGLGITLNLFDNIEFPDEHSPGFRLTIWKEFGNLTLGVFGGIAGDDLPFPGFAGDFLWEVGLGLGLEVGPVEIEAELRRETPFGPGAAALIAEAEAKLKLGEIITIVGGVEVEFGPPAEVTAMAAIELALGRFTFIPSITREFAGPETTLAFEVQFAATDRLTLAAGIEREETDPPFIWAGFELVLGGDDSSSD